MTPADHMNEARNIFDNEISQARRGGFIGGFMLGTAFAFALVAAATL